MRRVRRRTLQLVVGAFAAFGLVAVPAVAADCPNAGIRAQQGPLVEGLPDCMALEMVSPPKKFAQDAVPDSVSVDGERVAFASRGAVNDPPLVHDFYGDLYVATRSGSGWSAESTHPPAEVGTIRAGWFGGTYHGLSFSPDFSRWVYHGSTHLQADVGAATVWQAGVGGAFTALSPLLTTVDGAFHGADNVTRSLFLGASADHSRVFFWPGDLDATFLAGDPSSAGSGLDRNVYIAEHTDGGVPSVALLARDSAGVVWGGRCGARLGGSRNNGSPTASNSRNQGAVSVDGSRVYFTTRPSQSGAGVCDSAANRLRIMRRVETGVGPWIGQLLSSECDRVTPVCDMTDGDDLYQGASVDGTKVYFTTTRQLADSDLDVGNSAAPCSGSLPAPGCDLYLYDSTRPAGDRLVQVSAGDAGSPTPGDGADVLDGIAAISGDGSHAYFVAQGILTTAPNSQGATATAGQPNLYSFTYDDDHPDGEIAFVGQAAAADGGSLAGLWGAHGTFKDSAYPVPATSGSGQVDLTGGDGHLLLFSSAAAFTTDDTDGGRIDVFRYDSESGELMRISRAAPGGSDNGAFNVATRSQLYRDRVGTDFAEFNRWVSEDGDTVVFRTDEGLASDDSDTEREDYLWRDGQIYRLPMTAGVSAVGTAVSVALSHDGSSVAFGSRERLLPQDGDQAIDTYVARVDGGFPASDPVDPCDALTGGCQGGGSAPVASDTKTSQSSGSQNAAAEVRKTLAVAVPSSRARRKAARSGRLVASVRSNRPALIRVLARAKVGKKTVRVGGGSVRLAKAGKGRVDLRLSRRARRVLRNGRALKVTLRVTSTGARARTTSILLPGVQS